MTTASRWTKGLRKAWPTFNHITDQTTFWGTKETWLTRVTLRDAVFESAGEVLFITIILRREFAHTRVFSMPRRHSVSDKWQWPRRWVEQGDFCPFANEPCTHSFNSDDWYQRSRSRLNVAQISLVIILEPQHVQAAECLTQYITKICNTTQRLQMQLRSEMI